MNFLISLHHKSQTTVQPATCNNHSCSSTFHKFALHGAFLKRINFGMPDECHAILKSVCALKGINMNDYIYDCVHEVFVKRALEDHQIQQIVLAGTYQPGTNAYHLKELILKEQAT